MVTIILRIRLELPGVASLKGKRRILRPLLTKLRNDFNVSVAEVGDNDVLRNALIGAAAVSNSSSFGHEIIAKVVNRIEAQPEVVVADYVTESY